MMQKSNKNTQNQQTQGPGTRSTHLPRRRLLLGGGTVLAGAGLTAAVGSQVLNTTPEPALTEEPANPDGRFAGQVVVITGATSGIGAATAMEFAREGAVVHFCGRRANLGQQVEQRILDMGGQASYQQADVREVEQVEQFITTAQERYGQIDIAFNNAGIFMTPAELHEIPIENYLDHINTNLNGVFYAMRYEIPIMREQGGGVIINMASVAGHRGFGNTAHYNASKHGLVGMTKAAAAANARHNIRINSISPLAVDTPMLEESFAYQGVTYEEMAETFITPRIMEPVEMARAVLFLASPEATAIAGMDLDVTGGQLA